MRITQLDTENADRNLTSIVTVLTHTPSASLNTWCQGVILLGDGTKNLSGAGGDFEFTVTVGGQTIEPNPQVVTFGTETRAMVQTVPFMVPANASVVLRVKSPNGADTDVDTTAYLYDVGTVDVVAASGSSATITDEAKITFNCLSGSSTTVVKMTTGSYSTRANEFASRFLQHVASGEIRTTTLSSDTAGETSFTVGVAFTSVTAGDAFVLLGSSVAVRA